MLRYNKVDDVSGNAVIIYLGKNKFKKTIALVAILVMAISVVACSSAEKLVMEEAMTEEQMMQSNAESEDLVDEENNIDIEEQKDMSYDEQLWLIAQNEKIVSNGKYIGSLYGSCAVTDLDENGRLEIVFSHTEGSGIYAYNEYYEVNETYDDLIRYEDASDWTGTESELLWYEQVDVYYNEEEQINYYIFDEYTKDGIWLYYTNRRALYLKDGMISSIPLAYKRGEDQDNDDEWIYTYEAADGETIITEEEYVNAADLYFDDYAKKRIRIRWLDSKECEVFQGTTQEIYEALHMSLQESSFAEKKGWIKM